MCTARWSGRAGNRAQGFLVGTARDGTAADVRAHPSRGETISRRPAAAHHLSRDGLRGWRLRLARRLPIGECINGATRPYTLRLNVMSRTLPGLFGMPRI